MMVSTKGRYALRVMIDLAEHNGDEHIPLRDIAERQEISEKYLESILKVLVQAGYLVGLRGKGGGYKLTRRPDQYKVGDILRLTENNMVPVSCLAAGSPDCAKLSDCRTIEMWRGLDRVVNEYLDGITVADLAKSVHPEDNYVI